MIPELNILHPMHGAFGDRYLDQYFGVWAIEETKANGLISMVSSIRLAEHRDAYLSNLEAEALERQADGGHGGTAPGDGPFRGALTQEGVAVIPIRGTLMKFQSSMSSATGTVQARRSVRMAAVDDRVKGIMMLIDSPGGTVAGTAELADDVRSAATKKPLWSYADDMMASAAYWIGSQGAKVGAHRTTLVGSLGTVAVLYDMSRMAENAGVTTHVFSTGKFKGAGAPGAPLTPEQQGYFQALIDETNTHFIAAVNEGRKRDLTNLFDGRVHVAPSGKTSGLIDEVRSSDEFYEMFSKTLTGRTTVGSRGARADNETLTISASDDAPPVECFVVESMIESTPAAAGEGVDMSTTNTAGATPGAAGGAQPASVSTVAAPAGTVAAAAAGPAAATWTQLKAACPGASNDFLATQMEAGVTVEQAGQAYMAHLLAESNTLKAAAAATPAVPAATPTKRPGITAVGSLASEQKGASADAFGEFKTLVAEKRKGGMSAADAVEAAAIERPDLHERVVA